MTRAALTPLTLLLTLLLPTGPGQATATAEDPAAATPVSPGDWQAGVQVADTCPSFSWGAVAGAQRYELAIFDAQWDAGPAYEEQQRQGIALRRIDIAAPALSWTPAGADCLAEGGSYLWFVRAQTAEGEGPWSAPRYFEIDYDADALTQTVRRELSAQLRQPEVWREVIQAALSSNGTLRLTPLAAAALAPASGGEGTAADGAGRDRRGANGEDLATVLATTFPNPAALKVNSPNGVVFNRSAEGGGIPAEGEGARFMWYPGKAALRAGYVEGTQWDNANMGSYSTAMGYSTKATGLVSTAMGDFTVASGYRSTAMGEATTASGVSSTATGYISTASGDYSTAMGDGTTASGARSTAMGDKTMASGAASTAMGYFTTASGTISMAMGEFTTAKSGYETAIGRYNTDYTPGSTTGWNSADRLFVIGNGTGPSARSDALVVLKNGEMTQASSGSTPNLNLYQGSANNFARLRLSVVDKPNFWVVSAGGSDNVFNIWYQGSGDLLRLHSNYSSGGANLMSMINGATLTSGGTWTNASDRALKNGFQPVDTGAILAQVVELPLSQWSYRSEPGVRHIGPVAQDFHTAFGFGDSDTAIATVDADGVALAAIQGLHRKLEADAAAQAATANDLKQQAYDVRAKHQALQAQQDAQQEQISAQRDLIAALQSELKAQIEAHQEEIAALHEHNAALVQRLAGQEQRLVSLEAENVHLAGLQADLAQLQAQVQVLQGQMAGETSHAHVALGW